MGSQITCDICGAPDAHDYKVNVSGMGLVVEDSPTASEHAMELCDKHVEEGVAALFKKAYGDLMAAVPKHRALVDIQNKLASLSNDLRNAVIARDNHVERTAVRGDDGKDYTSPKDAEMYVQLNDVVAGVQSEMEALQQQRNEILESTK